MAERAFETPKHFSNYVVIPNIDEFKANPDSLKSAFNCVMSIDALAGHIYQAFRDQELTPLRRDSDFRHELADRCNSYRVIFDAAKTYKHIQLTGAAIIKSVDQTKVSSRPFGSGAYGAGSYSGEDVMIELNDGDEKHCLSEAVSAHNFLLSLLS